MRRLLSLVVLAGLMTAAVAAERLIIEDRLLGQTVGERFGGRLTADGFAPVGPQDHLLYRIPAFFTRGYATFEMRGMMPVTDGDHAFFAIYDGRGIAEPARYFEDFRENFFRFNLHWRGSREAIKCVVNCAQPTEERRQAVRAVFPHEGARDWVAEPTGQPVAWEPQNWHLVRIDWSETVIAVSVDGRSVWRQELVYPYRPVEPRIWLGCAPGHGPKYTHQINGLRYRNFRLVSLDEGSH